MNHMHVDLNTKELDGLFLRSPIYLKKSPVLARKVEKEETVDTVLTDGSLETSRIAIPGDMIIQNPGGEEYVISASKFDLHYKPCENKPGQYWALDGIRAIKNPFNQAISIKASWGSMQYGDIDCILACGFDAEHPELLTSERYIIGANEFTETYIEKSVHSERFST